MTTDQLELKKIKSLAQIKNTGYFLIVTGCLKITAGILIPFALGSYTWILNMSFLNIGTNISLGLLFIILGNQITKDLDKNTKKYLWSVLIISIITGTLTLISTLKPSAISLLTVLLVGKTLFYSRYIPKKDFKNTSNKINKFYIFTMLAIPIIGLGVDFAIELRNLPMTNEKKIPQEKVCEQVAFANHEKEMADLENFCDKYPNEYKDITDLERKELTESCLVGRKRLVDRDLKDNLENCTR